MTNYDLSGRICSEGFTVSRFDGSVDAEAAGVPPEFSDYFHANVWPPIDGFREVMTTWLSTMRGLGRRMMQIFAVALGLSMNYFDGLTVLDASTATIRLYPARHASLEESPSVIFDEHFDGGMLTMLHQRGTYDGLQVRAASGEWVSVPVHDDAFVINVGALMSRWTNGRWPATRHRVVGAVDPEGFRYTLPIFFTVAVDTIVSPLPTTIGSEGSEFEPVRVYDWYRTHLTTTYRERKHTRVPSSAEAFVASLAEDRKSSL
jgi:isopenicillin N synthase-like dioxygenase